MKILSFFEKEQPIFERIPSKKQNIYNTNQVMTFFCWNFYLQSKKSFFFVRKPRFFHNFYKTYIFA